MDASTTSFCAAESACAVWFIARSARYPFSLALRLTADGDLTIPVWNF